MEELIRDRQIDKTGKTGTKDRTQGRTKQTQAARQQTRRQTEGDGQTDSDGWARRHTVQYAKGKGREVWVVGEREGGGGGHKWGIE